MDLELYTNVKNTVKADFVFLEAEIINLFKGNTPLDTQLSNFLTAPAKRLRPLLGFLFLRHIFGNINPNQHKILLAVELIHNATLIHDDVIDEAKKRRNQETINAKFDDNLAVVAGDFLLSIAFEKVIETQSIKVLEVFTSALKSTCIGEINQYFNKFNITSIDEYIEKSKQKTALLFQMGVLGSLLLSETEPDETLKQAAIDFSQNFGIAFQIRDDLLNILNSNLQNNDIKLGIYTAPIIFAKQENENILESGNIQEAINSTKGIEKTKDLMDNYFNKALQALEEINQSERLNDNKYKQAICKLIELLRCIR